MIFSCVGYESLIVPSKEYDHSFTYQWLVNGICMQNVIKIYYMVKSYEHFHELLMDGRTQIVIIVQTQRSFNSTFLKLPFEKGIFSPVVLSCQHFGTARLV